MDDLGPPRQFRKPPFVKFLLNRSRWGVTRYQTNCFKPPMPRFHLHQTPVPWILQHDETWSSSPSQLRSFPNINERPHSVIRWLYAGTAWLWGKIIPLAGHCPPFRFGWLSVQKKTVLLRIPKPCLLTGWYKPIFNCYPTWYGIFYHIISH